MVVENDVDWQDSESSGFWPWLLLGIIIIIIIVVTYFGSSGESEKLNFSMLSLLQNHQLSASSDT